MDSDAQRCIRKEQQAVRKTTNNPTLSRQALREQGDILGRLEVPGCGRASGHLPELELAEPTHIEENRKQQDTKKLKESNRSGELQVAFV